MRRHDWILDMLSDLRDYATANDLSELASSVEVTLAIARRETARVDGQANPQPDRRARLQ
jgi:predicted transcriptional regulator